MYSERLYDRASDLTDQMVFRSKMGTGQERLEMMQDEINEVNDRADVVARIENDLWPQLLDDDEIDALIEIVPPEGFEDKREWETAPHHA